MQELNSGVSEITSSNQQPTSGHYATALTANNPVINVGTASASASASVYSQLNGSKENPVGVSNKRILIVQLCWSTSVIVISVALSVIIVHYCLALFQKVNNGSDSHDDRRTRQEVTSNFHQRSNCVFCSDRSSHDVRCCTSSQSSPNVCIWG
jgi:hypothetical protein